MVKIIRNVLEEKYAEHLNSSIYNTSFDWWFHAYKYGSENPFYTRNPLKDSLKVNDISLDMERNFAKGNFVYRFSRSKAHIKTCTCYECEFNNYLNSDFLDLVKDTTDLQNPYIHESFISVYNRGDFLATHTDKDRGCAFVFNLTKNWRPQFGGLLNVIHTENKIETVFPEFNSLVLLDVSGKNGTPHFVSEISRMAPFPRVAISGWCRDTEIVDGK